MADKSTSTTETKSLMLQRKTLCDGQSTGRVCVYYWTTTEKVDSHNPLALKRGFQRRSCLLHPSLVLEMSKDELRTECNAYRPRRLPLFKRVLATVLPIYDPGKYDPAGEAYNPLTPEEYAALEREAAERANADALVDKNVDAFVAEAKQVISVEQALAEQQVEQATSGGIFASEEESE